MTSAVADRLTHAEERELAARIQAGDRAARDRMVVCNLPLVRMIARKYVGRGLDLDDLVSHGTVGLIGAVDRYDPARGTVFSTFAFMCIKDAIRLALQDECSTIRVPAHIHLMRHAAGKGDPIPDPHDSVAGRLEAADRALGLRSGQGGDGEFDPIASAVAPDEPEPDDSDGLLELLPDMLDTLPPRHAEVLRRRFGVGTGEPEFLETIGDSLGLSMARIRQIEIKALSKLRERAGRLIRARGRPDLIGPSSRPAVVSPSPLVPEGSSMSEVELTSEPHGEPRKSRFRCVYYHKSSGRWRVLFNGDSFGEFKDEEEAARAADRARREAARSGHRFRVVPTLNFPEPGDAALFAVPARPQKAPAVSRAAPRPAPASIAALDLSEPVLRRPEPPPMPSPVPTPAPLPAPSVSPAAAPASSRVEEATRELEAMRAVLDLLSRLSPAAAARVARWSHGLFADVG